MKATQKFIEDAIKGGWKDCRDGECEVTQVEYVFINNRSEGMPLSKVLLETLAWQAVGKTRGWKTGISYDAGNAYKDCPCSCTGDDHGDSKFVEDDWKYYMHRFVDDIANGKTIEEALEAIE